MGKASQNSRGAPLGLPEHLPQNQSLPTLLLCALTYTSDFMGGEDTEMEICLCGALQIKKILKFLILGILKKAS